MRDNAKLVFLRDYVNGSTESTAVTDTRNSVSDHYKDNVKSLIARNSRDMSNAANTYEQLNTSGGLQYYHVYAGGTELNTSGGVSFSIPTSLNDSANGTAVSVDGVSVQAPTITVANTTYSYQDNVSITMSDPAGQLSDVALVGTNYFDSHQHVFPGYDPSTADIVVAPNKTAGVDYTSIDQAISNASEGDVIAVANGSYTSSKHSITKSVTIVGQSESGVHISDSYTYGRWFQMDGAATDTPLIIENVTLTLGNGMTVVGYYSQGSNAGKPTWFKNLNTNRGLGPTNNADDRILVNVTHSGTLLDDHVGTYYGGMWIGWTAQDIQSQISQQQDILSALGDANGGYLDTVWGGLSTGALNVTDVVTYEQLMSNGFGGSGYDTQNWLNAQYLMMGMSQNVNSTVVVQVNAGSTLYDNASTSNSYTLSSSKTYSGTLATPNQPANGWDVNTTYNTSTLGGPVYIVYTKTTTKMVNGSLVATSHPATVAVKGSFTVQEIYSPNGTSVTHAQASTSPNNDPYNATQYTQQIKELNTRLNTLETQIQEQNTTGTGGGASPGSCGVNIRIPVISDLTGWTMCTGIQSLFVSGFLLVLLGIIGFQLIASKL